MSSDYMEHLKAHIKKLNEDANNEDSRKRLAHSTFATKSKAIQNLYPYYPYWIYPNGIKTLNPAFDIHSGEILNVKKRNPISIASFSKIIESHITDHSIICVVPSHDPQNTESGIGDIAHRLINQNLIKDGTKCIIRKTKIEKLSTGGSRNISVHLNSLEVLDHEKIKGSNIFLLDDIVTGGNSLRACAFLLLEAGATSVTPFALGKTTH